MKSAISNLMRCVVAIAMSMGFMAWLPGGDCARATVERQCGCRMCAGAQSCCAAPEDPAPAQQPAAPASRDSSACQPLAITDRPAVTVILAVVSNIFPAGKIAPGASATGHSFQSVRCIWTV